MTSIPTGAAPLPRSGPPAALLGVFRSWEFGLILVMAALYLAGMWINPRFFGNATALESVLRDAARYGVMAVGMTFVLVDKDLDLSIGSTFGLVAMIFSILVAPGFNDWPVWLAVAVCFAVGAAVGLVNGVLVTYLRVPAIIATLTMLFVGRGLVLAMSGGRTISYSERVADAPLFFALGERNALGFNNQILIFLVVAVIGGVVLARTRWGYETYAVGGNLVAAEYAGLRTNWIRIRAFLISGLCATLAGLMNMAQDKGAHSQYGLGAELIVIAAVIVGGASILGGRGRVAGSCLGAVLIVLIDKVLREGVPITRSVPMADGTTMQVRAMAQLPPGAVPAFLGLILVLAVLIEPWILRRRLIGRLVARMRGLPPPPVEADGVAIETARTHGSRLAATEVHASGLRRLLTLREAAAVIAMVVLWLVGLWLRPDFWGSLDNSFNLLLAFTEVALMAVGMAYVIGNGDIDLSVGSVLALSAATAAFCMKTLAIDPLWAALAGFAAGTAAGVVNGLLTTRAKLPAFIATLGMFYIARGLAAWLTGGSQLNQFPESYNLLGRKVIELLRAWGMEPGPGIIADLAAAISTQTLILAAVAVVFGLILWRMPFGYMVMATGGNRRAAGYAGIDTDRVRFRSLLLSAMCASLAGLIYIAYFRSFNPAAGSLRELDVVAAVIIGGGSIFGGFGSVLGALAGAAVITLIRAVLSLQIILADGTSFVLPQHWMNVFIGAVLILAVLSDIWLRQEGLLQRLFTRDRPRASGREATA